MNAGCRRLRPGIALAAGVLCAVVQAAPECAPAPPVPLPRCQSESAGRLIGGVAGALIGQQIGDDRASRAIGAVGGAIVGGAIGAEIGRRIDADDPACRGAVDAPSRRERTAAPASG